MKKNKFFSACLLTLFLSTGMLSCSQDDDVYSCNPEINDWVKENKKNIQKLTRAQWSELDYSVATAAYIAFTPSQKLHFWSEKFDEVKSLDWSDEELRHIQAAEDFIMTNTQYFRDEKLSDKELDDIEIFFAKWVKHGQNVLGWTKETAMAIVGTGFKMVDTDGNIQKPMNKKNLSPFMSTATEVSCHCNIGSMWSCIDGPFHDCNSSNCEETNKGCGFMLLYPCNGRCGGL